MTTTQHAVIKKVWEFVKNIKSRNDALAIAGGAITDVYFGKEFKDIDIFVSETEHERLQKFCAYYGFEPLHVPDRFKEVEDSYGNMRRVRIGKQESDIQAVYKGQYGDYNLDFVVVNDISIRQHVFKRFDQSIKACYYNGKYHYSDDFMETVVTGEIRPVRMEVSGYVRAWLSASKYDLEISSLYNMSKHYMAYAWKKGYLAADSDMRLLSEATLEKMQGHEEEMFNFEVERSNVILMDAFMNHQRENEDLFRKLCMMADKKVVARHPLHGLDLKVLFEEDATKPFKKAALAIYHELTKDYEWENIPQREATAAVNRLLSVTPNQYRDGKLLDEQLREARIGRYMTKIQRKHKELLGTEQMQFLFKQAFKALEVRPTTKETKVFFTGSKHALTHISTNTKWSSCQRWGGFGSAIGTNYGLLANVAGGTLVAYVADTRSDEKSSNWHARVLVRIGDDGSLLLERVYTDRDEFNQDDALRKQIQAGLREMGYTVHINKEEAAEFRSLPMWSMPYQDVSDMVIAHNIKGQYILKGRGEEIRIQKRTEKIKDKIHAFMAESVFEYYHTERYKRTAVVELPEEFYEDVEWVLQNNYGSVHLLHPSRDTIDLESKWMTDLCMIKFIEGQYVIIAKETVMHRYREKLWHEPLRLTQGQIRPVGRLHVGADMDGDVPAPLAVNNANPFAMPF